MTAVRNVGIFSIATAICLAIAGCGGSSDTSDVGKATNAAAIPTPHRALSAVQTVTTQPIVSPAAPAAPATPTESDDACIAYASASSDALFASSKRVFAHYFYPFPLSLDNLAASQDYYSTQYLTLNGESNKWLAQGGFLRQRPLAVSPSSDPNWRLANMEREIRTAMARGITGFTFDVMSVDQGTDPSSYLHMMMTAAQAVDSRFKIVVMPDITTLGTNSASVIEIISSVAASPASYRLPDGRLVVSAFDAGLNSVSWWSSVLAQLKSQGIDVAFVPVFLGWNVSAPTFSSITYGLSDWGTVTAPLASAMQPYPQTSHLDYGNVFMMPIGAQQYRPEDFSYWEAGNSASFRNGWMSAIQGDADWVQLVTWSDFSESSEIEPYTDATLAGNIGTGYYDLNGYYATWFLLGQQPTITHDVLYFFYRREPTNAASPAQAQSDHVVSSVPENDIELLAFLTEPGQLSITIAGNTYTQAASAGITSFKVPLQAGTPTFALSRSGSSVISFQGPISIYGVSGLPSGVADLTYWSGSASQTGICSLQPPN